MGVFYVFMVILLTVYGQLIIKWQVSRVGAMPEPLHDKLWFIGGLLLNPWVLSGFAAAFLASLFWMAALTKYPLNVAYPFMSLTFVCVVVAGALFFGEHPMTSQWLGLALVILGLIVGSQRF